MLSGLNLSRLILIASCFTVLTNCNRPNNVDTVSTYDTDLSSLSDLNSNRSAANNSTGCAYENYIYQIGTKARSASSTVNIFICQGNGNWTVSSQASTQGCKTDDSKYIALADSIRFNKSKNIFEQCNVLADNTTQYQPIQTTTTLVAKKVNTDIIPDTQGQVIRIQTSNFGETHLPGCANLLSTNPNICRKKGSFASEAYAIQLNTASLANQKNRLVAYSILGVTNDDMAAVTNPGFKKFVLSVSEKPGDFYPENEACRNLGAKDQYGNFSPGIAALNINVASSIGSQSDLNALSLAANQANKLAKQIIESQASVDQQDEAIHQANLATRAYKEGKIVYAEAKANRLCLLVPGKTYYANIRPVNPGCKSDINNNGFLTDLAVDLNNNIACRVAVYPLLPKQ